MMGYTSITIAVTLSLGALLGAQVLREELKPFPYPCFDIALEKTANRTCIGPSCQPRCLGNCKPRCGANEAIGFGYCGKGCQCCQPGTCPSPFKKIGSEYFYFHDSSKKNWDDALSYCKSIGGSLAEPADMDDFITLIESSYSHMKNDIWLGATDRSIEQDWKWLSGGSVPNVLWPAWPGNQPSGDGDCMQIHYHGYSGFFLNDYYCHVKGYFVCECTPKITTGCNGKCSTRKGSGYCKDACNRGEERLGSCPGGTCSCCRRRVPQVCAGTCTLGGGQRGFCCTNGFQNPGLETDLRLSLIPAPTTCNKGCNCCPIGIVPVQET